MHVHTCVYIMMLLLPVCVRVVDCPIIKVPGRVFPVTIHHLEELLPEMRYLALCVLIL